MKASGFSAMVTMQNWMFLSSFQKMRERLLREKTIASMAHLGPGGFDHASAMVVQTTAFVLSNQEPLPLYKPTFFRLMTIGEEAKRTALINREGCHASTSQFEFQNVPGSPLAYWLTPRVFDVLGNQESSEVLAMQGWGWRREIMTLMFGFGLNAMFQTSGLT